jgi:hypothetical protein
LPACSPDSGREYTIQAANVAGLNAAGRQKHKYGEPRKHAAGLQSGMSEKLHKRRTSALCASLESSDTQSGIVK